MRTRGSGPAHDESAIAALDVTVSQRPVGTVAKAVALCRSTARMREATLRGLLFMYATLGAGMAMIVLGYR